jgi:low temperature requirement protein LtrA
MTTCAPFLASYSSPVRALSGSRLVLETSSTSLVLPRFAAGWAFHFFTATWSATLDVLPRVEPPPVSESRAPTCTVVSVESAAAVVTFSDAISFRSNLGEMAAVDGAFAAMWLVWLATTLHANRYRDDGAIQRALVLAQMLLLTINALAVGDGFDAHPALISVTYALLALDVAVMYALAVHRREADGGLARGRRNQYGAAALPIIIAAFVPEPGRVVLWVIGLALLAWPTLGFRFGRLGAVPPFDEHHFVERLGLLTIIVCGESFVKVSLLAADGSLDGIDLAVLVTMFVFVFGVWWAYFDDVPRAGIRPEPIRTTGWLVGHLVVHLALVASAVG